MRGPSPIPVSLTELDAQGATMAVLKLLAVVECTKHPIKYFPTASSAWSTKALRRCHGSVRGGPWDPVRRTPTKLTPLRQ
jgi:hypothetical protein